MSNNHVLSSLDGLIQKLNASLECGTDCQRKKHSADLMAKWDKARENNINAPIEEEHAKKNYYTYVKGEDWYKNHKKQNRLEEAKETVANVKKSLHKTQKQFDTTLKEYTIHRDHLKHAIDTYTRYADNVDDESEKLREIRKTVNTSNRKVHYEDEELQRVKWWGSFITFIYYVSFIVFIIRVIVMQQKYREKKFIFITAILAIIPFTLDYFLLVVLYIGRYISSIIPKSFYR
jgi:hypothetical protein